MKFFSVFCKKVKRKSEFPLSQTSRIIVDRPKHNIGNKEFKKLVNDRLKPKLQNLQFEGKDYFYFRIKNDTIETILFGTSPYGKAICINVEIKKNNGSFPTKPEEIDKLKSISPHQNQGWKRLSPDGKDCWWWFRPTQEENQRVFNEMYKLIVTEGEEYFKKYNV